MKDRGQYYHKLWKVNRTIWSGEKVKFTDNE